MHEGIGSTIFHSQIAVHAKEMNKQGFEVDIWTFETNPRHIDMSLRNLSDVDSILSGHLKLYFGIYQFIPFSDFFNALIFLFLYIKNKKKYDVIHARSDYSAAVYSFVKRVLRVPLLWDCRGDSVEEIKFSLNHKERLNNIIKKIIIHERMRQLKRAGKHSTMANFVSEALYQRCSLFLKSQSYFITPCSVSREYFFFSESVRTEARKNMGYQECDVVFIYSGALSKYQSFSAYIELFKTYIMDNVANSKLLIVTPDINAAEGILRDSIPKKRYEVKSASFSDMNLFYNAADCGMLLRNNDKVNDVSSPTKFGEYCMAGLPVILDGNVIQSSDISKKIGNYVDSESVKSIQKIPRDNNEREKYSKISGNYFSREILNGNYVDAYDNCADICSQTSI